MLLDDDTPNLATASDRAQFLRIAGALARRIVASQIIEVPPTPSTPTVVAGHIDGPRLKVRGRARERRPAATSTRAASVAPAAPEPPASRSWLHATPERAVAAPELLRPRRRTKSERAITAYHEAGHVLAHVAWGSGNISTVSIKKDEWSEGRFTHQHFMGEVSDWNNLHDRRWLAGNIACVKLAGYAAEEIFTSDRPHPIHCLLSEDPDDLDSYLNWAPEDDDIFGPLAAMRSAYKRTADHGLRLLRRYQLALNYLRHHRAPLDALAASLLRNTELDEEGINEATGWLDDIHKWVERGWSRGYRQRRQRQLVTASDHIRFLQAVGDLPTTNRVAS
jgi:hypothetical protein